VIRQVLRVAVVGCGIGRSHILQGYLPNADRFALAAVCDINPDRAAAVATEFGVARQTTSFDELLRMDDIDVIDICTPPMLHYPQVLAALAAGKHVICEKPLVGSLKQMDEVIAAEARAAARLMPVFQYRFGNGVQQVKRIIDSGLVGKPYLGTAETLWTRGAAYYAVPWRGKWASELGGILMTHAIHIHDLLTYLMGPPKALYGRTTTRVNAIEVEDCISATVELQSGALATMSGTLGSREQISRLRLAFENVTFESDHTPYAPGTRPWRIIPADDDVEAEVAALLADWKEVRPGYATQFERFHEAVMTGGSLPVTTTDARQALEIITAFYQSSKTHRDVSLPIGPDNERYESWMPAQHIPRLR
jgi:predicted dehydrogenase